MERSKVKKYGKSGILAVLERISKLRHKYGIDAEDIYYYDDTRGLVSEEEWSE